MNWLGAIPDGVWGAFVGAIAGVGGTLLATFLSNRYSLKRLKVELAHEAEQKELERKHALRRDIYLPLAEAASAATAFLGQISTSPLEKLSGDTPIAKLGVQMGRLGLIAPRRVFEPAHKAFCHLIKSFMKLMQERIVLIGIESELSAAQQTCKIHAERQNEINAQWKRHVDAGGNQNDIMSLSVEYNQEKVVINELLEKINGLTQKKIELQLEMSRHAVEEVKNGRGNALDALIATRAEFGVPNEDWLPEIINQNVKELDESLTEFLDEGSLKVKGFLEKAPTPHKEVAPP